MFIALIDGGDGCDYNIDCNKTWKFLKATNIEEARKEVEYFFEYYGREMIKKMTILDVSSSESFDVSGYLKKLRMDDSEREAIRKQEEERLQYEKLKKKFG